MINVFLKQHAKFNMSISTDFLLQRQNKRRNTTFGVDFQEQVEKSRSAIPSIVTKCLTEIEKRGIMIKVSLTDKMCPKFQDVTSIYNQTNISLY